MSQDEILHLVVSNLSLAVVGDKAFLGPHTEVLLGYLWGT